MWSQSHRDSLINFDNSSDYYWIRSRCYFAITAHTVDAHNRIEVFQTLLFFNTLFECFFAAAEIVLQHYINTLIYDDGSLNIFYTRERTVEGIDMRFIYSLPSYVDVTVSRHVWLKLLLTRQSSYVERKRHTDHGVSSTPSVVLWWWGTPAGGYPIPGQGGYSGVAPHPDLAGVPPVWTWLGYPPIWTRLEYPPPPVQDQMGVHPPSGPGQGTPPQGWTDWKHNLPSRTTYAVGKKSW